MGGWNEGAAVWLVHVNIVIYAMLFWLNQPILPYLSKDLGADPISFGYLQTLFSFGQLVGGPLMGRAIDARGAKFGLIVAHSAAGLSYLLLGASYSLPVLFFSRIPTLLMHAMQAAQSAMTDLSDDKTRAQSLGRVSLSYGLGFLVGPSLGGVLGGYLGYHALANVAALLSLVMIIFTILFLPNTREIAKEREKEKEKARKENSEKVEKENENETKHNNNNSNNSNNNDTNKKGSMEFMDILKVMRRPSIRNILILKVLAGAGFGVYQSTFSTVAAEFFMLTPQQTGFVLSYSGGLSILVNTLFVGWATKRYSEGVIVKWALLSLSVTFLALSFSTSFYHLLLLMIPMSFAGTSMYTVVTAILTKSVSRDETGTVIGLDHATRSLSSVIAPTIGGYMFFYLGYSALGMFSSTMIFASFLLWDMLYLGVPQQPL